MHLTEAGAVTVNVNPSVEYQTMEGWGASSNFWEERFMRLNEPQRTQLFDFLFGELGTNILCIRLYPTFQTNEGAAYNWNVMADQRTIVNAALARGNIDFIWVKVSSPPGWMKSNGTYNHGGHVLPEYYDDYAQYLSYYIRHMASDYGITINGVSLFNEPNYGGAAGVSYDSTSTTPEEFRDILKVVGAQFQADGLEHVLLMGPECGQIRELDRNGQPLSEHGALSANYVQTLLADPVATGYLDRITVHQYGDQEILIDPADVAHGDAWEELRDYVAPHGKSIWETEMFVGGAGLATEDIHEGLRTAVLAWRALTLGNVTAWHYWQYAGPLQAGASSEIISYDDTANPDSYIVRPRYYCIKQWASHIAPGAVRIDTGSSPADVGLYFTAFKQANEVVIVAINMTAAPENVTFNCTSIGGPIRHVRTSTGENCVDQANITPGGHSFDTTLLASSMSTFHVPLGEGGPADQVPGATPFGLWLTVVLCVVAACLIIRNVRVR